MEKVPAVLRILCNLWRIALTIQTPQHRESVEKFKTWARQNKEQPSLVAIKEAIGFFSSKGSTGHYVEMANEWANSQPCIAMKAVMWKDMERLEDGSLLKEYLDSRKN